MYPVKIITPLSTAEIFAAQTLIKDFSRLDAAGQTNFVALQQNQALSSLLAGQRWQRAVEVEPHHSPLGSRGIFIAPAKYDQDPLRQSVHNSLNQTAWAGHLVLDAEYLYPRWEISNEISDINRYGILAVYPANPKESPKHSEYVRAGILRTVHIHGPEDAAELPDDKVDKEAIPLICFWELYGKKEVKFLGEGGLAKLKGVADHEFVKVNFVHA